MQVVAFENFGLTWAADVRDHLKLDPEIIEADLSRFGETTVKTYWPFGLGVEIDRPGVVAPELNWMHKDRLGSVTALSDVDGSELLSVRVLGIPAGATLSAGIQDSQGTWTLAPSQLSGLTLWAPASLGGNYDLTVQAVARILQQTNANLRRVLDGEAVVDVVNGLPPVVRRRDQP